MQLFRQRALAMSACFLAASSAHAGVDLQITEMWMGNDPGENLTEDWFEIVNAGDTAWISGQDASLYYDDDSQDFSVADEITGITDIQPGEAVIVLVTDEEDEEDAKGTFEQLWAPVYQLDGVEIGTVDGAGLGKNGDGVALFLGQPGENDAPVDFQAYPTTAGNGGKSWDVKLGAFSAEVATAGLNDANQPAIGTPGNGGPTVIVGSLPEITLLGDNPLVLALEDAYVDPLATASDAEDGDLSADIVVAGDAVDTATLGEYVVSYDVLDNAGNAAPTVTRTVVVTYPEQIPTAPAPAAPGLFTHKATLGGLPGAEIPAYDRLSRQAYVTGGEGLQIVDLSDPSKPVAGDLIDPAVSFGLGSSAVTSVDVCEGMVAFAVPSDPETDPGTVVFTDSAGALIRTVTVGALPDMLTFTADCRQAMTANEGEPDDGIDPEGSISIIDVATGEVKTADFLAFNGQEEALKASGVRLFPGVLAANDVEPEYIAIAKDMKTAWVTLQEANSVAVVDIASATVTDILPLGLKDHSLLGNELDASDRDSVINIRSWPLLGMYMPDAIAAFRRGRHQYYLTANEGDARNADERVSSLALDSLEFTDPEELQSDFNIGRIQVSAIDGNLEGDSDFEALYSYGARSFSIWNERGELVYDSGSDIEAIVASYTPEAFEDGRSDNKGPEPEGVEIGRVGNKIYAFIGLERTNQILVYDVSRPTSPVFMQLLQHPGDENPEGLKFLSRGESPNQCPTLLVTNEGSDTLTVYQLSDCDKGNKASKLKKLIQRIKSRNN